MRERGETKKSGYTRKEVAETMSVQYSTAGKFV